MLDFVIFSDDLVQTGVLLVEVARSQEARESGQSNGSRRFLSLFVNPTDRIQRPRYRFRSGLPSWQFCSAALRQRPRQQNERKQAGSP